MKDILKPPVVARILGVSPQCVRENIRRKIWTFGECIPKEKNHKKTDRFYIYRTKFEAYIGRPLTEEDLKKGNGKAA